MDYKKTTVAGTKDSKCCFRRCTKSVEWSSKEETGRRRDVAKRYIQGERGRLEWARS